MSLSNEEIRRYSRHLLLPQVGLEGQERLQGSAVLCVGAGGLGSPALLYLAAAGVGRIGIIDPDRVDLSNLQRQVLFTAADVGRNKAVAAREHLLALNPGLQIDVYEAALTSANAMDVLRPYDLVIDGTDNFPTRYLINDACVLSGKPYVYGSIYRFEGQVSVFNWKGGPTYRDLFPIPPPPDLVPHCGEGGVLGVLPGVVGGLQANEALKLLLGAGDPLAGRLLLYDALTMSFQTVQLAVNPAKEPVTALIDYEAFCGVAPPQITADRLSAEAVRSRLAAGWAPFVLDVRSAAEAAIASLPFTDLQHPDDQIAEIVDGLPRDRDLLVYCKVGRRSARVCAALIDAGFTRLSHLDGGIVAWSAIDPSIPTY